MQYHQQLKHPLWQKKRLEVLDFYSFTCYECGAKEDELHVHHPYYKRGAMLWDYKVDELLCLCHSCHKKHHAVDERLRKKMSRMSIKAKKLLIGACLGFEGEEATDIEEFLGVAMLGMFRDSEWGVGFTCDPEI